MEVYGFHDFIKNPLKFLGFHAKSLDFIKILWISCGFLDFIDILLISWKFYDFKQIHGFHGPQPGELGWLPSFATILFSSPH